jgi:hypothetical protein
MVTGNAAFTGTSITLGDTVTDAFNAGSVTFTSAGAVAITEDSDLELSGRNTAGTMADLTAAGLTEADGATLTAPALRLQGTGAFTLAATNTVTTLAADVTGNLRYENSGALQIGDVAGTMGVTNRGPGNTELMTRSANLVIQAPVMSRSGTGSITLDAQQDLRIRSNVQIDGSSARIVGRAGGEVVLDPGVVVATGTGQVVKVPVDVTVIPVDQGGSNVNALGNAIVLVTVEDDVGNGSRGLNYQVEIDWGDGPPVFYPPTTSRGVPQFDGRITYAFDHRYFGNPHPTNPAAPIPIKVTVSFDGRSDTTNGIQFFRRGDFVNQIETVVRDQLTVPGEGLFATVKIVHVVIEPVEFRPTKTDYVAGNHVSSGTERSAAFETQTVTVESAVGKDQRLFFRRVNAAGKESPDVNLRQDLLGGGLLDVFRRFPNGHYRVYLQDANSDRVRLIREIHVYQGRIVPADFREDTGERPSSPTELPPTEPPPVQNPPAPADESCDAPATSSSGPHETHVPRTLVVSSAAASLASETSVFAAAVTAGLGWAAQVERALAAGRKKREGTGPFCAKHPAGRSGK